MRGYIHFADQLSVSLGKAFSWCIVILMGGTCYEVIMAYAFNSPTLWNFDFSLQMYAAIFMMAGAYTLSTEAHVRGDVIYRLFKPKTQAYRSQGLTPVSGWRHGLPVTRGLNLNFPTEGRRAHYLTDGISENSYV